MITIDKNILTQLCSLKKEREDILRRIGKLDKEIERMEKEFCIVTDSVTCGRKGKKPLGTKTIQGFPIPEYEKKLRYKKVYRNKLKRIEIRIDRTICEAEEYIESIGNSRERRICRLKCLDDNLSWAQIAHKMGRPYTAESCRQTFERVVGVRK